MTEDEIIQHAQQLVRIGKDRAAEELHSILEGTEHSGLLGALAWSSGALRVIACGEFYERASSHAHGIAKRESITHAEALPRGLRHEHGLTVQSMLKDRWRAKSTSSASNLVDAYRREGAAMFLDHVTPLVEEMNK